MLFICHYSLTLHFALYQKIKEYNSQTDSLQKSERSMNLSAVNKHFKALVNLSHPSDWKGLFKCIEKSSNGRFEIKSTSWRLNVTWPPICFITGGSSSYLHTKRIWTLPRWSLLGPEWYPLAKQLGRQREKHILEITQIQYTNHTRKCAKLCIF